ncbi:unnamed protein product [Protopolystoma xenopodis]|uniref:Uncharacterized protein n=1 Tax=Protopolystoma xenopodis TaxID=117903 RepID=A0A3S5APS8_9PLAT|nr:unnamed protein product [Protopolystoma xenopodis]
MPVRDRCPHFIHTIRGSPSSARVRVYQRMEARVRLYIWNHLGLSCLFCHAHAHAHTHTPKTQVKRAIRGCECWWRTRHEPKGGVELGLGQDGTFQAVEMTGNELADYIHPLDQEEVKQLLSIQPGELTNPGESGSAEETGELTVHTHTHKFT